MTRFGICHQCNDAPFDDIDNHVKVKHKDRKLADTELYSGTLECKVCRNAVKRPRLKAGSEAVNDATLIKHECTPATPIKDVDGNTISWRNATGMDCRHYQLVLDPIQ